LHLSNLPNWQVRPTWTKSTYTDTQDIDGLMSFINKIILADWGENVCKFSIHEPLRNDPGNILVPQICMGLDSTVNGQYSNSSGRQVKQLGSRFMESLPDPQDDRMWNNVRMKNYESIVDFDVYANSQKEAFALSYNFIELIDNYLGEIKRHGTQNMFFNTEKKWETEKDIAHRKITYTVITQKIITSKVGSINEVLIKSGVDSNPEVIETSNGLELVSNVDQSFLDPENRVQFDTKVLNWKQSEILDTDQ
jgi:hypothetical protein